MNDQNYQNQNVQFENPNPQPQKKTDAICIVSLVFGIVSMLLCCNPMYAFSITAIVTGIVGIVKQKNPKGMAIAGLVLGAVSIIVCFIADLLLLPLTFGTSFFF